MVASHLLSHLFMRKFFKSEAEAADVFQSPAWEREDSKFLLNHKKNVSLDTNTDLVKWNAISRKWNLKLKNDSITKIWQRRLFII